MNDEQLQREIETIKDILRVRLRRYNRELKDLDKDLRELRALQRARRSAEVSASAHEAHATEGSSP